MKTLNKFDGSSLMDGMAKIQRIDIMMKEARVAGQRRAKAIDDLIYQYIKDKDYRDYILWIEIIFHGIGEVALVGASSVRISKFKMRKYLKIYGDKNKI